MKLLAVVLLAMGSSVSASERLLIVGTPVAASLTDNQCFDDELEVTDEIVEICMNFEYLITYKVIAVLRGSYGEDSIDSLDYYHYSGMPDHLVVSPACVLFERRGGDYVRLETTPAKRDVDSGQIECAGDIIKQYDA